MNDTEESVLSAIEETFDVDREQINMCKGSATRTFVNNLAKILDSQEK